MMVTHDDKTAGYFGSTRIAPSTQKTGQLRIYFTAGDKRPARTLADRLFGRPLYRDVIDAAKEAGILDATAHTANYGFVRRGRIEQFNVESTNTRLSVFVELVASRAELEAFCKQHAKLVEGKTMVYTDAEEWMLKALL